MAKRRRVKLSVGKILALKPGELEKMSTARLRDITTILNSAANKRIKRAERLGTKSVVIDKAREQGRFKVQRPKKGMTPGQERAQATAEFMRVREFMLKETSSTRGTKKTKRKAINKFIKKAQKLDIMPPETDTSGWMQLPDIREGQDLNDLIWGAVDKLAEEKPITKEMRYRAAGAAYDVIIKDKRVKKKDTVYKRLRNWYDSDYNQSVQEFEDVGDEDLAAIFKDFT